MKQIPYYSPNFGIIDFFLSLFISNAKEKCTEYYKELTGKEYILITSSCRSALYLAYKAISKQGKVISSPLICKTALEPIIESNNKIEFVDISLETFNMDLNLLPDDPTSDTIAIQATYLGGRPLDMDNLLKYKNKHKLILIEDCAQGFGSKYKHINLGSFGDIACFSMIKTAYGISGGILATNDKNIYTKAKLLQDNFKTGSKFLNTYRVVRNILETYRMNSIGNRAYNKLLNLRPQKSEEQYFSSQLVKPWDFSIKLFAYNIARFKKLHSKRLQNADNIISTLNNNYKSNYINNNKYQMLPTKLFFSKDNFDAKNDIEKINKLGAEAKHLQQKYQSYYQNSMNMKIWSAIDSSKLKNYKSLHDKIFSLPLYENMRKTTITKINSILDNE